MNTKTFEFGVNEERDVIDGKVYYPNFLHLHISNPDDALEIAESIIRQVRNHRERKVDITLTFAGKLDESDD